MGKSVYGARRLGRLTSLNFFLGLYCVINIHIATAAYATTGVWTYPVAIPEILQSTDWGAVADSACRYTFPVHPTGWNYFEYRATSPIPNPPTEGATIVFECHLNGDDHHLGQPWGMTSAGFIVYRTPPETYTLALSPETATIEPGKTYAFTATVTKQGGGSPSRSIPVSVKVEVDLASGGHDHGETVATRPKGSVSPTVDYNTFQVIFTATQISGTHTITASCDQCVNKTAKATVNVMVDGLRTIAADPKIYTLIGGEPSKTHHDNHYLTNNAFYQLVVLAINYHFHYPNDPVLHLNDASLSWGGLFDKDGDWETPHAGHRRGTVIDIRANTAPGNVPERLFIDFEKLAAGTQKNLAGKVVSAKAKLHCSSGRDPTVDNCVGDSNRHYHVILLGVDQ